MTIDNSIIKKNNFDFLRFFFAFSVLACHLYDLTLNDNLKFLKTIFNSDIAVKAFFVISGFLISMSYENSVSIKQFFQKRVKRIYPAYFTVVVASAILGVLITNAPIRVYLFSGQLLKYVISNLFFMNFIEPSLPGVFSNNVSTAIDGALWTIKIEVLFYLVVPLIFYLFTKINKLVMVIIIYLSSVAYYMTLIQLSNLTGRTMLAELARQLPGQLCFFISGTLIYLYFDIIKAKFKYIFPVSLIAFIFAYKFDIFPATPILLALAVISFSFIDIKLSKFGKYGDFSYGIYIFHFPVIQFLCSVGLFKVNPYVAMIAAIGVTFILAFLSWNLIESKFLKRRSAI